MNAFVPYVLNNQPYLIAGYTCTPLVQFALSELKPGARIAIHHRVGRIDVGEASVALAAASAHRGDAFAACRYAIERVKQIVPIWKREHFAGGEVWLEGATADPDDEGARQAAQRIACA